MTDTRAQHVSMLVVAGAVVVPLLVVSWLMDRRVRRRGASVVDGKAIFDEVREGVRDAKVVDSVWIPPTGGDAYSWTSWSRRNRGGRPPPL